MELGDAPAGMLVMQYVILGGGSVTAEFYLPTMARLGRLADVTVVDPSERSLQAVRAFDTRVRCIAQDHVAFMNSAEWQRWPTRPCVIIALPNQFHVEAVRLALERGCNVLCEKPLALKSEECIELRNLARQKSVLLKVAMSRRYLPSLMLARQIVKSGEVGKVHDIEVRDCTEFLWRPRSFQFFARESGGILADMGVHYLDFLENLVGPLTPLSYSDDARGGTESTAEYCLSADNVRIRMRLSRVEQSAGFIRIVGDKGEIKIDKGDEAEISVLPKGLGRRQMSLHQPFDSLAWPKNFGGSFCQMVADFEREVGGTQTNIADVADAEHTVKLIEWAYHHREKDSLPAQVGHANETPVVITGGTGFIGGHLLERLNAGTNNIRVAVRSPASCTNVARYPVSMIPTDLLDLDSVRGLVKGARTVFHLAYGTERSSAEKVTIDGTKNIVRAAIEASVDCVVILSTMYVFGFPKTDKPVDETFPYHPYGGEYGLSKAAMERWCLKQSEHAGNTRIVILNPTCVFGPGGGAYTTLPVGLAQRREFCWIEDGAGFCNYTYVENLVDAIVAAAQIPEAHGQRFIINDGVTTWRELIQPMLGPYAASIPSYSLEEFNDLPRYGGPFRVKDLIAAALTAPEVRQVAKRSAAIRSVFDRAKNLGYSPTSPLAGTIAAADDGMECPPEWLAGLFSPARVRFSAQKAQQVLRWEPRISLVDAQAATVEWLRRSGRLPSEMDASDF